MVYAGDAITVSGWRIDISARDVRVKESTLGIDCSAHSNRPAKYMTPTADRPELLLRGAEVIRRWVFLRASGIRRREREKLPLSGFSFRG
jgi:hypothetical protein